MSLFAPAARASEADFQWFKANYLPATRELERVYAHCRARVTTIVANEKDAARIETTYAFAFDGAKLKFDRHIKSNVEGDIPEWSRTLVGTPSLSFMILTKDGKTILEKVDRSALGLNFATEQVHAQADSIFAAFFVLGKSLSKRIERPTFAAKHIRRTGNAVQLEFKDSNTTTTYEGSVELLPAEKWVISRYDITLTKPAWDPPYSWRRVCKVRYAPERSIPIVESIIDKVYHPDRTDTEKTTVKDLAFGPAPPGEFTLSHYGYDDRIGRPPSSVRSLWFWLAAGGAACLVTAFVIRQIMVRRAIA